MGYIIICYGLHNLSCFFPRLVLAISLVRKSGRPMAPKFEVSMIGDQRGARTYDLKIKKIGLYIYIEEQPTVTRKLILKYLT